jgi:hypothetical protein
MDDFGRSKPQVRSLFLYAKKNKASLSFRNSLAMVQVKQRPKQGRSQDLGIGGRSDDNHNWTIAYPE